MDEELKNKFEAMEKEFTSVKAEVRGQGYNLLGATIFICLFLSLLMAMTSNPAKSKHIEHLAENEMGENPLLRLGVDSEIKEFVGNLVEYKNYWFFSVTKSSFVEADETIKIKGQSFVTIGFMGNIFDASFPEEIKRRTVEVAEIIGDETQS